MDLDPVVLLWCSRFPPLSTSCLSSVSAVSAADVYEWAHRTPRESLAVSPITPGPMWTASIAAGQRPRLLYCWGGSQRPVGSPPTIIIICLFALLMGSCYSTLLPAEDVPSCNFTSLLLKGLNKNSTRFWILQTQTVFSSPSRRRIIMHSVYYKAWKYWVRTQIIQ